MAEDEYNKKMESLQQYIPFLNNIIAQLKDPRKKNKQQQLMKMVSLHSMITDKSQKLKLETLINCEGVIIKLYDKMKSGKNPQLVGDKPSPIKASVSEPLGERAAGMSKPPINLKDSKALQEKDIAIVRLSSHEVVDSREKLQRQLTSDRQSSGPLINTTVWNSTILTKTALDKATIPLQSKEVDSKISKKPLAINKPVKVIKEAASMFDSTSSSIDNQIFGSKNRRSSTGARKESFESDLTDKKDRRSCKNVGKLESNRKSSKEKIETRSKHRSKCRPKEDKKTSIRSSSKDNKKENRSKHDDAKKDKDRKDNKDHKTSDNTSSCVHTKEEAANIFISRLWSIDNQKLDSKNRRSPIGARKESSESDLSDEKMDRRSSKDDKKLESSYKRSKEKTETRNEHRSRDIYKEDRKTSSGGSTDNKKENRSKHDDAKHDEHRKDDKNHKNKDNNSSCGSTKEEAASIFGSTLSSIDKQTLGSKNGRSLTGARKGSFESDLPDDKDRRSSSDDNKSESNHKSSKEKTETRNEHRSRDIYKVGRKTNSSGSKDSKKENRSKHDDAKHDKNRKDDKNRKTNDNTSSCGSTKEEATTKEDRTIDGPPRLEYFPPVHASRPPSLMVSNFNAQQRFRLKTDEIFASSHVSSSSECDKYQHSKPETETSTQESAEISSTNDLQTTQMGEETPSAFGDPQNKIFEIFKAILENKDNPKLNDELRKVLLDNVKTTDGEKEQSKRLLERRRLHKAQYRAKLLAKQNEVLRRKLLLKKKHRRKAANKAPNRTENASKEATSKDDDQADEEDVVVPVRQRNTPKKRRGELENLHVDMFIHDGVLTATEKRLCRTGKSSENKSPTIAETTSMRRSKSVLEKIDARISPDKLTTMSNVEMLDVDGCVMKTDKSYVEEESDEDQYVDVETVGHEEKEDLREETDPEPTVAKPLVEEEEKEKSVEFVEPDKNYFSSKPYRFKMPCKLCDFDGSNITQHYRRKHPKSETLSSRLSPETAEQAIKESLELNLDEIEDRILTTTQNYPFKCRFCNLDMHSRPANFHDHITTHTGEYRHLCTLCSFSASQIKSIRLHYHKVHARDRSNKIPIINTRIYGYICLECNFVQINRKAVENHVNIYHLGEGKKICKIHLSSMDHVWERRRKKTGGVSNGEEVPAAKKLKVEEPVVEMDIDLTVFTAIKNEPAYIDFAEPMLVKRKAIKEETIGDHKLKEENPFPFKIAGVLSLADEELPSRSPIKNKIPKVESVIMSKSKLTNIDKAVVWKSPEAFKKFVQNPHDLYKCPLFSCKYCTNFRHLFESHIKEHSRYNDELVRCVYCSIEMPLRNARRHIELRHFSSRYSCSVCLYRALLKEYVVIHMKQNHKENDAIILLPSKCVKLRGVKKSRTFSVREACPAYVCGHKDCGLEFLFQDEFVKHVERFHNGVMLCNQSGCNCRSIGPDNMIDHWCSHNCYSVHCLMCESFGSHELYAMLEHYALMHPNNSPMVVDRRSAPSGTRWWFYTDEAIRKIKYLTYKTLRLG